MLHISSRDFLIICEIRYLVYKAFTHYTLAFIFLFILKKRVRKHKKYMPWLTSPFANNCWCYTKIKSRAPVLTACTAFLIKKLWQFILYLVNISFVIICYIDASTRALRQSTGLGVVGWVSSKMIGKNLPLSCRPIFLKWYKCHQVSFL